MTKYVTNSGAVITANGDYYVADVNKKRDFYEWFGTFLAYGTWGGATVTFKISPDGGTTKLALKDASGTDITSTADDNFTVNLAGGAANNDAPKLYASVTNATGTTSLRVVLYDNNG